MMRMANKKAARKEKRAEGKKCQHEGYSQEDGFIGCSTCGAYYNND